MKYVKCGKMVRYYSVWSDQKFWYPNIPNRNRSKKKWISFENFPRCNSKFQPNATSNATAGYITSPVRIPLNSSKIRLAIKCFHSPWRKQQKISWSQKKILVALCRRQNFSVGCFLLSSTKKKKLTRFYMRWLCTEVSTFLFTFDLDDTYGSLNIWLEMPQKDNVQFPDNNASLIKALKTTKRFSETSTSNDLIWRS